MSNRAASDWMICYYYRLSYIF